MKKLLAIILGIILINFGFAVDLDKYFTKTEINLINTYLEKFHNRINKLPISKQCQKYTNITKKIKKFEEKVKSKKILVLLEYINEKITNRAKICKTAPSQSKLQKQTNKQESKISKKLSSQKQTPKNSQKLKNKTFQENIKINYDYLKRNSILTPLSGTAYAIYGINIKPFYGDVIVKSLLFKNIYGTNADVVIDKGFLISLTGKIITSNKFVNGYIYFELPNPIRLKRNTYTPFYVAIYLKTPDGNTTNKIIKLALAKQNGTFKTTIISADNGREIGNWHGNEFYSNTYIIRKSKPLLKNYYTIKNLHNGFRQFFSIIINSTGGDILVKSLRIDTYLYKTRLNTKDIIVKINNKKFSNVKIDFTGKNYYGNGILKLTFGNDGYKISTGAKIDFYGYFQNTKHRAKALFQLKDISEYTGIVDQNYSGNYSILWSDTTFKNGKYNRFTDKYLNFSNLHPWYLRNH